MLIKELQEVQGPPKHKFRCTVWPETYVFILLPPFLLGNNVHLGIDLSSTLLSHTHPLVIIMNPRRHGSGRDRIFPSFANKKTDILSKEGNKETWARP